MSQENGLTRVRCAHDAAETVRRFKDALPRSKMTLFAQIDHAAAAAEVGYALRPTVLLIFGAALGGTPLMQLDQACAIDLPLKALVWEDEAGVCWLEFNTPEWIVQRHGLGPKAARIVRAMEDAIESLVLASAA